MSEPVPCLLVTTEELAARMPRDAYMVDADRLAWENRFEKFKTDEHGLYMVVPPVPFYAFHESFRNWPEQELYRHVAGAENEQEYYAGIEKQP